jgi:hypothetical protein
MFGRAKMKQGAVLEDGLLKTAESLSEETKKALGERIERLVRKDGAFAEWLNAK